MTQSHWLRLDERQRNDVLRVFLRSRAAFDISPGSFEIDSYDEVATFRISSNSSYHEVIVGLSEIAAVEMFLPQEAASA